MRVRFNCYRPSRPRRVSLPEYWGGHYISFLSLRRQENVVYCPYCDVKSREEITNNKRFSYVYIPSDLRYVRVRSFPLKEST